MISLLICMITIFRAHGIPLSANHVELLVQTGDLDQPALDPHARERPTRSFEHMSFSLSKD